ncbi:MULTISPECIES: helix-turn-helix transcriptional regulator [unclassified Bradyrhizobium]|uniref:helix-turn-helix domain-containing protein n=1 Tax=unclassified Bradyrhizobium TaxID=2631580 RepID=UPI001047ED00|nr:MULTISPECIES: helix-turn-helix transcriptional regulator [unclassified Bradyrhizobium]
MPRCGIMPVLPFATVGEVAFWRAMAIRHGVFCVNIGEYVGRAEVLRRIMKRVSTPSRYAVRAAIAASLRQDRAVLPQTAHRLGISARSLQRRLAEMGTTYAELVAEVRLDTACHLLAESDENIADIAARLGFAGASSFSRNFARLMKIQPIAYRRQQSNRTNGSKCGPFARKPAGKRFSGPRND